MAGKIEFPPHFIVELKERIRERVRVASGGCWIAGNHRDRYTTMSVSGVEYLSHRASYAVFKGPVPADRIVRHTCDVRGCINPEHLVLGTHQDNSQDMVSRGRARNNPQYRTLNFVGQPKKLYSFRFPTPYIQWVDDFASEQGSNRTEVISLMVQALAEGRLFISPRKYEPLPNPFPGDEPYQDPSTQMFPSPEEYEPDSDPATFLHYHPSLKSRDIALTSEVPSDLADFVTQYAESRGQTVSEMTAELFGELLGGRLYVQPRPDDENPLFPEPPTTEE